MAAMPSWPPDKPGRHKLPRKGIVAMATPTRAMRVRPPRWLCRPETSVLIRYTHVAAAATDTRHNAAMSDTPADLLTVAISSRALFDLEESNSLFEARGIDAYAEHQRSREDDVLEPGIAFPLVRKLLALNEGAPPE